MDGPVGRVCSREHQAGSATSQGPIPWGWWSQFPVQDVSHRSELTGRMEDQLGQLWERVGHSLRHLYLLLSGDSTEPQGGDRRAIDSLLQHR